MKKFKAHPVVILLWGGIIIYTGIALGIVGGVVLNEFFNFRIFVF